MMKEFNQSRRDSMRKMLIATGACVVMANAGSLSVNSGKMTKTNSNNSFSIDDKVLSDLSQSEKVVYTVVKENTIYSKNVKDDDILTFTKHFVSQVNDENKFEGAFKDLRSQMELMSLFIKYIHA